MVSTTQELLNSGNGSFQNIKCSVKNQKYSVQDFYQDALNSVFNIYTSYRQSQYQKPPSSHIILQCVSDTIRKEEQNKSNLILYATLLHISKLSD